MRGFIVRFGGSRRNGPAAEIAVEDPHDQPRHIERRHDGAQRAKDEQDRCYP